MFTGLFHAHSGFAYLLLAMSTIHLLIAVAAAAGTRGDGLMRAARIVQVLESVSFLLVVLVGVGAWVSSGLGAGAAWLWAAVVGTLAMGAVNGAGVRKAYKQLVAGQETAKKWAGAQLAMTILGYGLFGFMHAMSRL